MNGPRSFRARLEHLERSAPQPDGDRHPSLLDHDIAACVADLLAREGASTVAEWLLHAAQESGRLEGATKRDAALLGAEILHFCGRAEDAVPLGLRGDSAPRSRGALRAPIAECLVRGWTDEMAR
jgi:hypothetical protein